MSIDDAGVGDVHDDKGSVVGHLLWERDGATVVFRAIDMVTPPSPLDEFHLTVPGC